MKACGSSRRTVPVTVLVLVLDFGGEANALFPQFPSSPLLAAPVVAGAHPQIGLPHLYYHHFCCHISSIVVYLMNCILTMATRTPKTLAEAGNGSS